MKNIGLTSLLAIVVTIAFGLGAPTGSHMARAHEPGEYDPSAFVQHAPCHEVIPDLIEVGYDDADGMIPNGYTAVRDDEGTPEDPSDDTAEIQLVTGHCQRATVAGVPLQDVIVSYWHIRIVPYDSPLCGSDGVGCPERPPHDSYLRLVPQVETPVESELREERYLFQWVTNKKEVAQWVKRGTGLGEDVVRYVPDLEFRYNPQPVDPTTGHPVRGAIDNNFFFSAPLPTVAPFHIGCDPDDPTGCAAPCATEPGACAECQVGPAPGCGEAACDYAKTECARVAEPFAGEFDPGENYWRDTEAGTVIIFGEHPVGGSRIAAAGGTITSDDSNSPLGRLFDDKQTRGTASGNAAEDQTVIEWLSAEFTDDVQWTICVRHAPGECTPEEHPDPCAEPLDVSDPTCDFPAEPLLLAAGALALARRTAGGAAVGRRRGHMRRPGGLQ